MKFPISVWTGYYPEYTTEEAIDAFLSAGFAHSELSTDHAAKLLSRDGSPERIGAELAAYAADRGFTISQGHVSFARDINDDATLDSLKRELDLFSGIGINAAVFHANGCYSLKGEARAARRAEQIRKIAEYVKGTGMYICLENLGSVPETHTVEKLQKLLADIGAENVGICLDIGHLHLVNGRKEAEQTQREFILGAGSSLRALHVTNNSGQGDDHLMPFSSRYGVDYKEVILALIEIEYKGLFNLEILGENKAPLEIRRLKLNYIRKMVDYMFSDAYLK